MKLYILPPECKETIIYVRRAGPNGTFEGCNFSLFNFGMCREKSSDVFQSGHDNKSFPKSLIDSVIGHQSGE